jgi:hypothetical protein
MAERKLDTPSVSDMLEIYQNLSRNFMSTAAKSWKVWETTFADKFTIDFGGVKPPQKTTPKDLMNWAKKTYATVDIHLGDQRHQNPMVTPATSAPTTATSATFMRFTSTSTCGRPTAGGFRRSR